MGQRDDLLAGAKRCIAEKGYSRTTARDITATSGANLAAIGYHFGSKDTLLNVAVLESIEEWGNAIEKAAIRPGTEEPLDRLERFLAGFLAGSQEQRATLVASSQAFAEAEFVPEVRQQLADTYEEGRTTIAAMLLGIDPGEVDQSALSIGSLVMAIINGVAMQWLIDPATTPSAADFAMAIRSLAAGTQCSDRNHSQDQPANEP